MKKTNLDKITKQNIIDIIDEPKKQRYSVLELNGTRKQITRKEFFSLAKQVKSLK